MPWFTKKKKEEGKFRLFRPYSRPISACFGRFRPVSAVSVAGWYDPIWPIRPNSGRISPVRHESSHIGANQAKSAQIREKKKKKKRRRRPTRGQLHWTQVRHPPSRIRAFYLLNPYYIKSNCLTLARYFPLIIHLNLNGLKLWARGDNNPTHFLSSLFSPSKKENILFYLHLSPLFFILPNITPTKHALNKIGL